MISENPSDEEVKGLLNKLYVSGSTGLPDNRVAVWLRWTDSTVLSGSCIVVPWKDWLLHMPGKGCHSGLK